MTTGLPARPAGAGMIDFRPLDDPQLTAAWYGDVPLELALPEDWSVTVHAPDLPPPLDHAQLVAALRAPVGAPPLDALAVGSQRVVIVIDDLTRPTPADVVLAPILDDLERAGIVRGNVTVLIATGTHGPATADAMARKVGQSARGCQVISHDDLADCPKIGVTRMGTPVFVNRELLAADLVIGVGGVYPQHTTGFGGGAKLALGVLGRTSIARLHFGHESMNGRYDIDNDFRADLAEIARLVGLRWMALLHVNARRQVVRLVAGDPELTYPPAAKFSRERYVAPPPADADVVIANAYPIDTSATFMRSKGVTPLLRAPIGASRLLLAACPEGLGHHGLFPLEPPTAIGRLRQRAMVIRARGWREVRRLGIAAARRPFRSRPLVPAGPQPQQILMYQTIDPLSPLPAALPGMRIMGTWPDVIDVIRAQQQGRDHLRVVVYPCAPLQVFEP